MHKQDLRNEALRLAAVLDEKAGKHYWQQDQGFREESVFHAGTERMVAFAELLDFINNLIEELEK